MTKFVHFPYDATTPLAELAEQISKSRPHVVLQVPRGALMPGCDSVCAKCQSAEVYANRIWVPGAFIHIHQLYGILLIKHDAVDMLRHLHHGWTGKVFPGYINRRIVVGKGVSEYRFSSAPGNCIL